MKWEMQSKTEMRCDPLTVVKVTVKGKPSYDLWHDKRPVMVGSYSTFEQAKAAALREEMIGQA